jgi:hypothetical protein
MILDPFINIYTDRPASFKAAPSTFEILLQTATGAKGNCKLLAR